MRWYDEHLWRARILLETPATVCATGTAGNEACCDIDSPPPGRSPRRLRHRRIGMQDAVAVSRTVNHLGIVNRELSQS